jgi:transcriptional regulator with XRE-family HTH domain
MPKQINAQIGSRIHARRRALRMTQKQLAAAIGITTQQIQKYEDGLATIAAARLWQISQVLGVSPAELYDGCEPAAAAVREAA